MKKPGLAGFFIAASAIFLPDGVKIANHNQKALFHGAVVDQAKQRVHCRAVGEVLLLEVFERKQQRAGPLRANSRFAAVGQMLAVCIQGFAGMGGEVGLGSSVLVFQRQAGDDGKWIDRNQFAFVHGVDFLFVFGPEPVKLTGGHLVKVAQLGLREHVELFIHQRSVHPAVVWNLFQFPHERSNEGFAPQQVRIVGCEVVQKGEILVEGLLGFKAQGF